MVVSWVWRFEGELTVWKWDLLVEQTGEHAEHPDLLAGGRWPEDALQDERPPRLAGNVLIPVSPAGDAELSVCLTFNTHLAEISGAEFTTFTQINSLHKEIKINKHFLYVLYIWYISFRFISVVYTEADSGKRIFFRIISIYSIILSSILSYCSILFI